MAKIAKDQRRWMRQKIRGWRTGLHDRSPEWARRAFGPLVQHLDMIFVDHGIFRLVYLNKHKVGRDAWRAAQPAPHQIRAIARSGVRTIVNLRGARHCGSYFLEQQACETAGVRLVDYQVRSRAAPSKEELHGAKELFESIEYPMLMHCKSGADRAGLMSTLFLMLHEGKPVEEAKQQLSARFGHFRAADTGILDFFFERYIAFNAATPMPFLEWVDSVYDPKQLKRDFHAKGWANIIVNKVLRRE